MAPARRGPALRARAVRRWGGDERVAAAHDRAAGPRGMTAARRGRSRRDAMPRRDFIPRSRGENMKRPVPAARRVMLAGILAIALPGPAPAQAPPLWGELP